MPAVAATLTRSQRCSDASFVRPATNRGNATTPTAAAMKSGARAMRPALE